VHGFGHLMGYNHELSEQDEAKMLAMEKKWLSSINMDGLYD
jgi:ssRNA-specific RNase YbeY (16S rRNA maturation enzyme)